MPDQVKSTSHNYMYVARSGNRPTYPQTSQPSLGWPVRGVGDRLLASHSTTPGVVGTTCSFVLFEWLSLGTFQNIETLIAYYIACRKVPILRGI